MSTQPENTQDNGKQKFNLSAVALNHPSVIWYFMIVCLIAGVMSYINLGREEDPEFTIKTMVIAAQWPGASAEDTINQVTDRIEKKLEELDELDYTKSVTIPGQTTIYVYLRDKTKNADVRPIWAKVRHMVADMQAQLPLGVVGPFFNDRFGDVYDNVFAFTADRLTQRQLRDYVEFVRTSILTVPNVGKVDLIGAQDEVIYLEFDSRKIANLGLDQQAVTAALYAHNAIVPSGVIQAGSERISVRVSGHFTSEESLEAFNLRVNDKFFRLSDVVTIKRGYADPPTSLFRFNGKPAIGLAISMKAGANLLEFGKALDAEMHKVTGDLPVGVGVHLVADQPHVVDHAIGHFTRSLFEAVAIVLVVSFLALRLETEWKDFEIETRKYLETFGKDLEQQQAVFQSQATAQLNAWRETADKLNTAGKEFAIERRREIDEAVARMKADATVAKDKLQKLAQAGTESWSALTAALAETRGDFDRAHQAAREAFNRAMSSAQ